ncbi:MAG TPA: 6-phospho-beta-glucosidase [Streptosporangiaceae bacterium]|nr:6-phospho-beta-glucosidase [Streptosporangiaceae bacterium]
MKVAVIGGGSTYTPELVDGVARLAGGLGVAELALVDPDEGRLSVVGQMCARIMRAYGHPAAVTWTTVLDEGLDGAGAVLLQLRVGGQAARQRDESWPLEYGCLGQETTGAGGLAKALRTVPVVLGIAERARERADKDAWIIDFTNPVGIVTRALLDAGHRAIGLCNNAITFQRHCARLLGVDPGQVALDHVGLNHLTWERAVIVAGTDRLPELLAAHGDEIAAHAGLPPAVLRDLGAVPSYYLHYYYAHDAVVAQQRSGPTRAEQVAEIERQLLAMYADPALDRKPGLLAHRGGAFYSEAAVALLAALVTDAGDRQVVNVRNAGTFGFLPDDAVIEVPAVIGADGAATVPLAPLPAPLRGLVAHVSAYEELALDAALRGGRHRVVAALLAHPLVGQYELAARLADRLIAENGDYLPWAGGAGPAAAVR